MLDTYEKVKNFNHWRRNVHKNSCEILFLMTTECNFRCSYCYEQKYKSEEFNLNYGYSLIDKILEPRKYLTFWKGYFGDKLDRDIVFNFFGGEPLLEVDKMSKLIDYFEKRCIELHKEYLLDRFSFTFQSNGYLLQTPKVKEFLYKYQKYMTNEFITIDGCKEMHDACRKTIDGKPTFDVVFKNILWFRKEFPDVVIETKGTITPSTIKYLYDSVLTYEKAGFDIITITDSVQLRWNKESLKEANSQFKKLLHHFLKLENANKRYTRWRANTEVFQKDIWHTAMCHVGGEGITLYPDGRLYICQMMSPLVMQPENNHDYKIGDINNGISEEGLSLIEDMKGLVDKYQIEHSKEKCQMCRARSFCGNCPAYNLKYYNNIEIDDKHDCKFTRLEQAYAIVYRYMFKERYGKEPD